MLIYDDSFVAVMTATQDEATRLGARRYGSEHVLLGLLAADDWLTAEVTRSFPALTRDALRAAVESAADDAPHLARLGITTETVETGRAASGAERRVAAPRAKHAPELQAALSAASAKWAHLRDTHREPRERKVSSAVLWFAVLEPATRASRLLETLGVDPGGVRDVLLGVLLPAGGAVRAWPATAPLGPVSRLMQRVFERIGVDR